MTVESHHRDFSFALSQQKIGKPRHSDDTGTIEIHRCNPTRVIALNDQAPLWIL